ncbi:MAG: hypothetical protein ACFE75_04545 [Candidatus Hodarchaeota archaeon]
MGVAWLNGGSTMGNPSGSLAQATEWQDYNYNVDYGTHDWVADFALDVIGPSSVITGVYQKWFDSSGVYFWSEVNKIKFFLGTRAADRSEVRYMTRHGQWIRGEGDAAHHHIRFNPDTHEVTYDYLAKKADLMARAAIYALQDGDCGTAAFFLGQMAHYITDASCFYHVAPSTSMGVSSYASHLELRVLDRTCGRSWGSTSFNRAHRQTVFRILPETYVYVYPPFSFLSPGKLAIEMAYNTFFGGSPYYGEGLYNYDWMNTVFKDDFYEKSTFWPIDQSWLSWSGPYPTQYLFILRLEESLNKAITFVASALNWVISQVPSFTCKSGPGDPPDEYFRRLATDFLLQGAFKAIAFIGIYASIYSVSVTSSKILK